MTKKKKMEIEDQSTLTVDHYANLKTIYADRIVNFAIGPMVSKLVLAQENPNGSSGYSAQIVIPTPVLFDVVNAMHNALSEDENMKNAIIESLDSFKDSLELNKKSR